MNITELRKLQSSGVTDLISTLRMVEINPTELCNRKCVFCPRSESNLYKNQKKHIDPLLCKNIGEQLQSFNFNGRIGFAGFSEPLLHPDIVECVRQIRTCKTAKWVEINTNGDILTRDLILELVDAGCTNIAVSMYDSDQTEYFTEMFEGTNMPLVLRHHYDSSNSYNLNLVNRIDIVKNQEQLSIQRHCYIPFYKILIDSNGDYLLCDQDWKKATNKFNVSTTDILDFWLDKINDYRRPLADKQRILYPCSACNVNGTVHGEESFQILKGIL